MKKDAGVFLGHILDSIEIIESYSRGKTELDLMESVGLQDQIIRRIEIIGEAVKNLPEDLRRDHPEVPWRDMAGMRDIVSPSVFWGRSRVCLAGSNKGFSGTEGEDPEDTGRSWQRGQVNERRHHYGGDL